MEDSDIEQREEAMKETGPEQEAEITAGESTVKDI